MPIKSETAKQFVWIEECLPPDARAIIDQWATLKSKGGWNANLDFQATFAIRDYLAPRFDLDLINAWCDSLVEAKRAGAKD